MRTSDFYYELPQERIAQTPVTPRHDSRLLVLDRAADTLEHTRFWEVDRFLRPGDLLVINETRVIPARIYAKKLPSGGKAELLLLDKRDEVTWTALGGGKGLNPGRKLSIEEGPEAEIVDVLEGAKRLVRFNEPIEPYFGRVGHVPLPPYIHTELSDPERYQTVYANQPGSAAAPTAGLHFTPDLMEKLREMGVGFARVDLHVGLDTFAPVTEDDPAEHKIHTEWCELSPETAEKINAAKRAGGRVIAVGTTSVRTLETAARQAGPEQVVAPFAGPTNLYILPGFTFKAVDAMVTNFHLPKSTLLMLVSAFAGRERMLATYNLAIAEKYRFFSFGDAMLIL
ncbi:MAG: tRNA preQ1(34) S-adenosylmethionine ribosyltransferase-isomerase QueA [Anaerolineaceae bacterium]|nr:tRNA preQ1(34) S-adenosylmethionine ribosyltransferase-isomerase QueA [Anaerolineaceae bacterium]